ncbi:MAG: alpha/beta hydrolase, partial [Actinomycetota bacterium]|nr:alpha/beta hydrolase [Actinomycetota bacterium]
MNSSPQRNLQRVLVVAAGTLVLAACGGESSTSPPKSDRTSGTPASSSPPASPTASALPRIEGPVGQGETVEGLVDVDGHDIYARCRGTGSPTVVYFTGWADDPSKLGVSAIQGVESVDGGQQRICSYERRNTGRSETVHGTQSPEDIVGDVDGVLAAMGEEGPFVLLGASFGGLVAGAYAVAHPDSVAGILLLD